VADVATRNGASAPGAPAPQQPLTALGAAFLGVGAMVGAGIFALLGRPARLLRGRRGVTITVVLVLFAIDTARNAPETFAAMLVLVALAIVLDAVWKHLRRPARA
jgi:hypothetical protein